MVVIFSKQFKKIVFLSLFLILSLQFAYSKNVDISFNEPIIAIDQDPESQKLSFDISSEIKKEDYTQTLSHLSSDDHKANIYEHNFLEKIESLGEGAFSRFVVDPIVKEIEFRDDCYVFYHGQEREFLLFQDLFSRLSELVKKRTLKDFVILRVPDKDDYKKFKNVKEFLKECKPYIDKYYEDAFHFYGPRSVGIFKLDFFPLVRNILLSVNPSLFGSISGICSCSFEYFLSSRSLRDNSIKAYEGVFKYFNLDLNKKYELQINELIQLLKSDEKNKTGILLQIFIPKKMVNEVSYRSIVYGTPYYRNLNEKASKDLSIYHGKKWNSFFLNFLHITKRWSNLAFFTSFWLTGFFLNKSSEHCRLQGNRLMNYFVNQPLDYLSNKSLLYGSKFLMDNFWSIYIVPFSGMDQMQFRILLSEDIMLNPDSGVKIFRYFNETEAVKEYKIKLDKLLADISRDYNF